MSEKFKPLLYYIAGLMASSIALVAAAFSVMKDAKDYHEWKSALMSFMTWMAITIVAAAFAALFLQWRRIQSLAHDEPTFWPDYFAALIPSLTGLLAAVHLILFACRQGAHPFFV